MHDAVADVATEQVTQRRPDERDPGHVLDEPDGRHALVVPGEVGQRRASAVDAVGVVRGAHTRQQRLYRAVIAVVAGDAVRLFVEEIAVEDRSVRRPDVPTAEPYACGQAEDVDRRVAPPVHAEDVVQATLPSPVELLEHRRLVRHAAHRPTVHRTARNGVAAFYVQTL